MSWENWIRNNSKEKDIYYDKMLEMVIDSYDLRNRTRKMGQKDRMQFVIVWWLKNKTKFTKYDTVVKVAKLFEVDHATIIHHYTRRKSSRLYEEETKCIKDFIES